MIGFTIKKAFFDFWDNLFRVILMNLGFVLLLAVPVFLPYWVYPIHVAVSVVSFILGILLLFVYAGAVSFIARDISDYAQPGFPEFFFYLKESWKESLAFGCIATVHIALLMVAFPVYSSMKNFLGLTAMIFLFWISVMWLLSCQYYFPLRARLDRNVIKIVKKCFLLFFDNTFFTITLAFGTVVVLALSIFTALILPGIAAALLWFQVAFKILLLKYDYLEKNPGTNRRAIPWDMLLAEERERVGRRTLKGMIFPWKE